MKEALLPLECFYDTVYHLNTEGVRLRSELLGRRLAQALGRSSDTPTIPRTTRLQGAP